MLRVAFASTCVIVLMAGYATLSTRDAQMTLLSKAELSGTVGGGCQFCNGDSSWCTGVQCNQSGSKWLENVGTNVIKAWCQNLSSGSGACNCNQDDICHTPCFNVRTCNGPDGCTNCGEFTAGTYVKAQCNMDGQPCTKDTDCDD